MMKRISLKLFLALLTFLIGSSLTAFWIFIKYPIENVVVEDTEQSQIFHVPESKDCSGRVEIVYESSLMGVNSLDGIFRITNNSCETVYYFGNHQTNNQNSWIKQNGKVKYIEIERDTEIKERELKPNETTWFWIPTPQNSKPFEAGFTLRIGVDRKEERYLVTVKKQLEHY